MLSCFFIQKTGSPEKKLLLSVLISTDLLSFVVRLLWIRIPDECTEKNAQPWNACYFNSLMVLKGILTLPHYTQTNRTHIMENNTVEALLDFCDADLDLLGCYPAVHALKTLCCLEHAASDRIVSLNALSKIGNLILKDNCQKMIVKAYRRGLKPYEKRVLEDRFDQSEENFKVMPQVASIADRALNVLRSWSRKMQIAATVIVLQVSSKYSIVFKCTSSLDLPRGVENFSSAPTGVCSNDFVYIITVKMYIQYSVILI